jgi:hypothetical protein
MKRVAVFAFVGTIASMVVLLSPQPGHAGDFGVGVSMWLPLPPPVVVVRPPAVVYAPPAVYGYDRHGYSYYGHAPRYYRDHGYGHHKHRGWKHGSWGHSRGKHGPPPWAPAHGWRRKHRGWHD